MEKLANVQDEEIEIDLQELFFVLLNKIWIIIICAVVGAVIAAGVTTMTVTPMYSSTSMIYIKSGTDLSSLSMTDLQMSSALTSDYMVIVTSRPVVNQVISNLELDMTYGGLVEMISTENPTDSHMLKITVQNEDPYMAKTIVDELTQVTIKRTAETMETSEPKLVEEGTVNENQISPNLRRNVMRGGIIGFVLSVIAIVLAYLLNDSIRTADDVERYLGLEMLGTIPMEEGKSKKEERRREAKHHRERMKQERKSTKGGRA